MLQFGTIVFFMHKWSIIPLPGVKKRVPFLRHPLRHFQFYRFLSNGSVFYPRDLITDKTRYFTMTFTTPEDALS